MNIELGRLDLGTRGPRRVTWRRPAKIVRVQLVLCLLAFDVAALCACVSISASLRGGIDEQSGLLLLELLPIYLLSAINARAFDPDIVERPSRAASRAAQAFGVGLGCLLLLAFSFKTTGDFSRLVVGVSTASAFIVICGGRYLIAANAARLLGGNPYSTVLICDGDQPIPAGNYSVIIPSDGRFDPTQDDPAMYHQLSKQLEHADRVVVMCAPERRTMWAHVLKGANVQGEILAPELRELEPLGVELHGSVPAVIVSYGPLKLLDRAIKRGFDLVVAGSALLLIAPLFLVIAVGIRLQDGGPVFFVQKRIGRGNKQFHMFKFRSMRVSSCDTDGQQSTRRDDERITRLGRLIRATSIDELPQLLNVLAGHMSIVGPRPHALGSRAADKLFWEVDRRYWHRHAAKPGLTGLAQVRGFRGATHKESDLLNRLQADLEYLDHWSIWRDLKIILLTFGVLLHRNAY